MAALSTAFSLSVARRRGGGIKAQLGQLGLSKQIHSLQCCSWCFCLMIAVFIAFIFSCSSTWHSLFWMNRLFWMISSTIVRYISSSQPYSTIDSCFKPVQESGVVDGIVSDNFGCALMFIALEKEVGGFQVMEILLYQVDCVDCSWFHGGSGVPWNIWSTKVEGPYKIIVGINSRRFSCCPKSIGVACRCSGKFRLSTSWM